MTPLRPDLRVRARHVAAALATMLLGFWVHIGGLALRPTARDVAGDALWAAMIAWGVAALVPAVPLAARAGVALAISAAVEFSQLIHTPTLDAWRETPVGGLVLGSGFDPRDLVAYAVGIGLAMALERIIRSAKRPLRE